MAIDNNESYYNNLLLENLDNNIPVVRTTETPIHPILEKNASKVPLAVSERYKNLSTENMMKQL